MFNLGLFMTLFLALIFLPYLLLSRFTPMSIFQRRLNRGVPIFLTNFLGWLRYHFLIILYFSWGAFLLTPILSFIPILVFDIRISIYLWEIASFFTLFVLYSWKLGKYHKKIAHTKYYVVKECLGLRYFGNDIIIPFKPLLQGSKKMQFAK